MLRFLPLVFTSLFSAFPFFAQASVFGEGWALAPAGSSLSFTFTKGGDVVETSTFATLSGEISPEGVVVLSVDLDSLDSGIALRDARMRTLLFETYRFPTAEITARLDPDALAALSDRRRLEMEIPVSVGLNGVSQEMTAGLDVALLTDDIVSVSLTEPLTLSLGDFGLLGGLQKLEAAAGVDILPRTQVTVDLVFKTRTAARRGLVPAVSMEACIKRVATIGASDQVYFTSGSAELETKSFPLLDAIADTIRQCPGMIVGIEGHTDNVGDATYNLGLSEDRAASVVAYLTAAGIAPERLSAQGFGEDRPIADNTTRRGRWQNRRIDFAARPAP